MNLGEIHFKSLIQIYVVNVSQKYTRSAQIFRYTIVFLEPFVIQDIDYSKCI